MLFLTAAQIACSCCVAALASHKTTSGAAGSVVVLQREVHLTGSECSQATMRVGYGTHGMPGVIPLLLNDGLIKNEGVWVQARCELNQHNACCACLLAICAASSRTAAAAVALTVNSRPIMQQLQPGQGCAHCK
jgi:hypothetical protein